MTPNLSPAKSLPGFPLTVAAIVLSSGAVALATADARGTFPDLLPGTYQRAYETRFEEALPLAPLAGQAWTALRMATFNEVQHGALRGTDDWLFTLEEFVAPPDAPDAMAEIIAARDALAARGITLIPVIVPDKARIMADHHTFARAAPLTERFDAALAALDRAGLPTLDTRVPLHALGPAAYLRTDTHWSPEGARAVAQMIAAHLSGITAAPGSFTTQATGRVPLRGDLRAFADAGPFAPMIGARPDTISTYETTTHMDDAGLFGTPDIPVALVGTSFSARTDLHFEGFLKSALGADLLNLSAQGQGPFAPMHAALAGEALTSTAPHTVIWEIPERYIHPRNLQ